MKWLVVMLLITTCLFSKSTTKDEDVIYTVIYDYSLDKCYSMDSDNNPNNMSEVGVLVGIVYIDNGVIIAIERNSNNNLMLALFTDMESCEKYKTRRVNRLC